MTATEGEEEVCSSASKTQSSSLIFHDEEIELTWVLVSNNTVKSVFGICYRPPNHPPTFCASLQSSLNSVKCKFPNAAVFLFGDFNFPHISWPLLTTLSGSPSSEAKQFINLALDFNLHQIITCPTRGDNTLDLLLVSNSDDVKGVTLLPELSDHNLIHISISLPVIKRSPSKKFISDYKRGNFEAFYRELNYFFQDFKNSYLNRSVNTNWEIYKNIMLNLKNKNTYLTFLSNLIPTTDGLIGS